MNKRGFSMLNSTPIHCRESPSPASCFPSDPCSLPHYVG